MSLGMKILLVDLFLSFSYLYFVSCNSTRSDTLLAGQSLSYSAADTLVSKQGKFELGFFTPGDSDKLYVGIWYKTIMVRNVVWTANRDNPIRPPSNNSILELSGGNLQLLDALKQRIWDTNLSTASTGDVNRAVLLDTGNLVLTNGIEILWQSFDYPTDTWLPGARIGFDKTRNTLQRLSSWKSRDDPAAGIYSLQLDQNQSGDLVFLSYLNEEWRTGPWNQGGFASLPQLKGAYNFSYDPTEHRKNTLLTMSLVGLTFLESS